MERLKLRPVTDAEHGRFFQMLSQQNHKLILTGRIKRGSRLVKNNDIRLLQDQPRESQPLLFTA